MDVQRNVSGTQKSKIAHIFYIDITTNETSLRRLLLSEKRVLERHKHTFAPLQNSP